MSPWSAQCVSIVANGYQRRDIRPTRLRRPQPHHSSVDEVGVHRIPRPTFVTIAIRPSIQGHETCEEVPLICPTSQPEWLRHIGTTGKSPRQIARRCQHTFN